MKCLETQLRCPGLENRFYRRMFISVKIEKPSNSEQWLSLWSRPNSSKAKFNQWRRSSTPRSNTKLQIRGWVSRKLQVCHPISVVGRTIFGSSHSKQLNGV